MYLFGNNTVHVDLSEVLRYHGTVQFGFSWNGTDGTGPIDQVMISSNPVMAHARRDMKSITS